jgi:hypothetical protein
MTRPEGRPRVQVHPGSGLVVHRGSALLVVPSLPAGSAEPVRALAGLCAGPDPGGAQLGALLDRWPGLPGFALLRLAGGAVRMTVHGPVRVLVDGRPGPAEVLEDGAWHGVTITADGDATVAVDDVLPLDLVAGAVPGAGVTLHPAAAAPEQRSRSETALRPAVRFRSVPLGPRAVRAPGLRPPLPVAGADEPAPEPAAEVLVEGVRCPQGHFTDPERPACLTCGAPLTDGAPRMRGPRPPLGILVTDGGTIYPVTGDVVIGREPQHAADVLQGLARPLPLHDAARSTSRVHARLTVRGWTVLLADGGSANGTFVSGHGAAGPWLPVQSPLLLAHGDRIRLGRRQLLFDAWRESVAPQAVR